MDLRERFIATCNLKKGVAPPKWEFGYWGETIDKWYAQGLPKENYPEIDEEITTPTRDLFLPAWQSVQKSKLPKGLPIMAGGLYWPTQGCPLDSDVRMKLQMDKTQQIVDVNTLACPMFEVEVAYEDESYFDFRDVDGIVKRFQKDPQTIPAGWEWPIKDWKSWNEYKEQRVRIDNVLERLPKSWPELVEEYNNRDYPLGVGGFPCGIFGTPAHLLGYEHLFINYFEQPDLIHDILETFTDVWIAVYEEVFSYTEIDHMQIWEDISFGSGSMVSPALMREFMMPYYKKLIGFMKSKGVDIILLDTDGDCSEIIPFFIEAGITGMYPFEYHCGMRVEKVRKDYPELVIMGGIPKAEITLGIEHIDEFLKPIERTLKSGGYIPYGDHLIPPDVGFKEFSYYRNKLNTIIDSIAKD